MSDVIESIRRRAGLSIGDWNKLVLSAPYRYKHFTIPKRSGEGRREIAQPARELKAIQRIVVNVLNDSFSIHPIAKAYRPSVSITDNALEHVSSRWLLKMDFRNFFPTVSEHDVASFFRENKGNLILSDSGLDELTRILVCKNRNTGKRYLAIGAPSSPWLSNIMMYEFDQKIFEYCRSRGWRVTRYADDVSISGDDRVDMPELLRDLDRISCSVRWPTLNWNYDKVKFLTNKNRKIVTGLIVDNQGNVGVGRDRRREVRSVLSKVEKGGVPEEGDAFVGFLSFMKMVERDNLQAMLMRYGFFDIHDVQSKIRRNREL